MYARTLAGERGMEKTNAKVAEAVLERHDGKMASVSESCNAVLGNSSASQDKVGPMPAFYQVNCLLSKHVRISRHFSYQLQFFDRFFDIVQWLHLVHCIRGF